LSVSASSEDIYGNPLRGLIGHAESWKVFLSTRRFVCNAQIPIFVLVLVITFIVFCRMELLDIVWPRQKKTRKQ
jgi:hypothetical protein